MQLIEYLTVLVKVLWQSGGRTWLAFPALISAFPVYERWIRDKATQWFDILLPTVSPWWTLVPFTIWWIVGLIMRQVHIEKTDLTILFENRAPFEITEPSGTKGHAVRKFRVGIRNDGSRDLNGCLVKLVELRDQRKTYRSFLPVSLRTEHQTLQHRSGRFNLSRGEHKILEVVEMNEKNSNSEIILRYESTDYPNMISRQNYIVTLEAYGGGKPRSERFKLNVDNGFLRFSRFSRFDELLEANMGVPHG